MDRTDIEHGCWWVKAWSKHEMDQLRSMWESGLWRKIEQIWPGWEPGFPTFVFYPLRPEDV